MEYMIIRLIRDWCTSRLKNGKINDKRYINERMDE